jgi:hypothetical protein
MIKVQIGRFAKIIHELWRLTFKNNNVFHYTSCHRSFFIAFVIIATCPIWTFKIKSIKAQTQNIVLLQHKTLKISNQSYILKQQWCLSVWAVPGRFPFPVEPVTNRAGQGRGKAGQGIATRATAVGGRARCHFY